MITLRLRKRLCEPTVVALLCGWKPLWNSLEPLEPLEVSHGRLADGR